MRLTCPCCGAQNSLEALLNDAAARQAVAVALALPGLGDRLVRYLGLFRAPKHGLTWDRAARLLEELNTAIAAGQITRHGQDWPAPLDYWKSALDQVLDARPTLTLPLKTHGYLYEVVLGHSRKATEARATREERAAEQTQAREGERRGMQGGAALLQTLAALAPDPSPAGALTPDPSPACGRGARDALSPDPSPACGRGERAARPTRSAPPAAFRALLKGLTGVVAEAALPDPPSAIAPDHQ